MVDGKRPEKGLFLWGKVAVQAPIGLMKAAWASEKSSSAAHWLGAVALKMSGASADWVQLHQEIFLGNMRVAPVWNLLGETEDSFLTFYAKK